MSRSDQITGFCFLALGLALLAEAWRLPAGIGRLPGPAFFPALVGGVMTALSLPLLRKGRRAAEQSAGPPQGRLIGLTILLLAAYLALWGVAPFAVRTPLFACALLRLAGESWTRSALVAVLLTAATLLAFQYGLRVDLG